MSDAGNIALRALIAKYENQIERLFGMVGRAMAERDRAVALLQKEHEACIALVEKLKLERDTALTSARLSALAVIELTDDRRRALKFADQLTPDTQTCEEAVVALVAMVRAARARADMAETHLVDDEEGD